MVRHGWFALAALACASCLEGQGAEWPTADLAVHFLIRLDPAGRAVEWTPARTSYEPLTSTLEAGGTWVLLGIPAEGLTRIDPWFDPKDVSQLELSMLADDFDDCRDPGRVVNERFEQALDDSDQGWAQAFVFRGAGFESVRLGDISQSLPLEEQLMLTGTIGRSSCERSHRLEVRPFGADSPMFDTLVIDGRTLKPQDSPAYFNFQSATPLDEDRALVLTARSIFIARRNGGAPSPGELIDLASLEPPKAGQQWYATAVAVDPAGRRAIVTLQPWKDDGSDAFGGAALLNLRIDGDRLIEDRLRVLAPSAEKEDGFLSFVAFGTDGSHVAAGDSLVATASAVEAMPQLYRLEAGEIRDVIHTGQPDRPHVLADGLDGYFVGDARAGEDGLVRVRGPSADLVALRVATKLRSGEIAGGSTGGDLLWLEGAHTRTELPVLPLEASACGVKTCGRPHSVQRFWGLGTLEGTDRSWLVMTLARCAGVFALDPATGCMLATTISVAHGYRLEDLEGLEIELRRIETEPSFGLSAGYPALLDEVRVVELE